MARFNLQVGVAWPNVISFRLLRTQSYVPVDPQSRSEKNFWIYCEILRRTFHPDSFVIRPRFLCIDSDDSLVEPVHSEFEV
jgi:hypothetical protein